MSKAVLTTKYANENTILMQVRAGTKGTGKVLFSQRYWDNGKASDAAHSALKAWQKKHPDVEVTAGSFAND